MAGLLLDLGLDVAVLELSPVPRFAEAVRVRAPELAGDARLPEDLERAAARRLNPALTTVARIFDDALAESLDGALAVDEPLSASGCAASAFIGAATDERALRALRVGTLDLIACRYTAEAPVSAEVIADWRARGVRVLALRGASGSLRPPTGPADTLAPGDEIILCGPAGAVQEIVPPSEVTFATSMGLPRPIG